MSNILQQIIENKKEEIADIQNNVPNLNALMRDQAPAKGFAEALTKAAKEGYGLIAEIKKASPSKGLIRSDFNPQLIAGAYERGGATCLSILTDYRYFQGHLDYLAAVREVTSLPLLRKDFMVTPLQVLEARAYGADAVLIIMAAVDDSLAREIEDAAFDYGMDVLIEIHNDEELERAKQLRSPLLGVNSRNLKTMKTSLKIAEDLLKSFPKDRLAIAESGLNTPKDLAHMAQNGARCFLIGEALMRQENIELATKELLKNPLPIRKAS